MTASPTRQEIIDEIIKETKKLDKMGLQILLARLRVTRMLKEKRKPVAKYDSKKIKIPSVEEINAWKHQARKSKYHKVRLTHYLCRHSELHLPYDIFYRRFGNSQDP